MRIRQADPRDPSARTGVAEKLVYMASATTDDLDLANAVRSPSMSDAGAAAIAELLRLAEARRWLARSGSR